MAFRSLTPVLAQALDDHEFDVEALDGLVDNPADARALLDELNISAEFDTELLDFVLNNRAKVNVARKRLVNTTPVEFAKFRVETKRRRTDKGRSEKK